MWRCINSLTLCEQGDNLLPLVGTECGSGSGSIIISISISAGATYYCYYCCCY